MEFVVLLLVLLAYFMPSIAAASRKHPSASAIFLTNLLLGWSVLGWIIALIWAFTGKPPEPVHVHVPPPAPAPPAEPSSEFGRLATQGRDAAQRRPCPRCAEAILPSAKVCPHCRGDLAEGWAASHP